MDRGRPLNALGSTREELESLSRSLSLAAGLVSRARASAPMGSITRRSPKRLGPAAKRSASGASASAPKASWVCTTNAGRESRAPSNIYEVMVLLRKTLDTEPADGSTHWSCRSMADTTGVCPRFTASGKRSISNLRQKHFKSTDAREGPRYRRT